MSSPGKIEIGVTPFMALRTIESKVDEPEASRADKLVQKLTGHSRSELRGLFDHQCVHVNGILCSDPGQMLGTGDHLLVKYDPHTRYKEKKGKWADRTFSIVFEDEHVLVIDKTAGVLSVATEKGELNTLEERVGVYLSHGRKRRDVGIVHRLDREVSGLLVIAKTDVAKTRLVDQFKQHKPERLYDALVLGEVEKDSGTVRNYLATAKNLDRFVAKDEQDGELAVTHFRVIERLDGATWLSVQLETGRRNQIRVHLGGLRHPLLGDDRYGRYAKPHPKWTSRRIALHAGSLTFVHPSSGKLMNFKVPLPKVMERFVRITRKAELKLDVQPE